MASVSISRISDDTTGPQSAMMLPIEGYETVPVKSLEEVVVPLMTIVRDIKRRASEAKLQCKNPPDGLTPDESASIVLFTAEWKPYDDSLYFILNATLRTRDTEQLKPWFLFLKLITTALDRLPPIGSRTVYRGVTLDLYNDYSPGKTIFWWGFSSCTTTMDVLQEEQFLGKQQARTLFIIESVSGRDIHQHSSIKKENEVLLLPATQFKVISCLDQGPNLHIIQLKEVAPLDPSSEPLSDDGPQEYAPQKTKQPRKFPFSKSIFQLSPKILSAGSRPYENTKLTKMIAKYKARSSINLERESLTEQDIPIVIEQAMLEKKCTMLRLSHNQIKSPGVSLLADALHTNTTLIGLYIFGNHVTDQGVSSLSQVLSMPDSTLKALSLGGNDITDEGAGHLADMLRKNNTLIDLYLPLNRISDCGLQRLARALTHHNRSLKRLSLDSNKLVTDASIDALVDVINQNRLLTALSVFDCTLSKVGKTRIRDAAKLRNDMELHV